MRLEFATSVASHSVFEGVHEVLDETDYSWYGPVDVPPLRLR